MAVSADFEYQRMRSIARLSAIGIELTPPDDNDIVTIQQKAIHNGRIRTFVRLRFRAEQNANITLRALGLGGCPVLQG